MWNKFSLSIIITLLSLQHAIYSQVTDDTLRLSLHEADSLFLARNLDLLARKYNIDENEAYVMQAKLWDLPNFSITHNAYNPESKKFFELSSGSETSVQVQQLIVIGGKRSKLVSMARNTADMARYQYLDLVRSLKSQLHTTFFNIDFLNRQLRIYDTEIPMLEKIVNGTEAMYPKGFVALKEVVRLKALLFSLKNEQLSISKQLIEAQQQLHLLLAEKSLRAISPVYNESDNTININQLKLSALIDSARHNRADLLALSLQNQYSQTDLAYQKALNIPNPTVMAGWDHNGGIVKNYNYIGVSIDLPFWNHNHGNIRAAEARNNAGKAAYDSYLQQVDGQVSQSYAKALETEKLLQDSNLDYNKDFTKIINGTTASFMNHEIGLLEFVDLYESYKDSQLQLIQLQNDRASSIEDLSFTIGKSLN